MLDQLEKIAKPPSPAKAAAVGLGYQFLAAMLIFVGGGYYLDQRRGGESHLFTLIGVALAFLYSGYEVWKVVRILEKESGKPDPS
ncbi:MAG TPA: AtpZ/AtpI family protein [Kiritimatiellia bacterium]|nr:AtpZ/AtpI family protein [Kiritimatiellia bacterium]